MKISLEKRHDDYLEARYIYFFPLMCPYNWNRPCVTLVDEGVIVDGCPETKGYDLHDLWVKCSYPKSAYYVRRIHEDC